MIEHEKEAKSSETSLALTKELVLESAMMLIPGAAQAVGMVRSIYAHRFASFVNRLAERLENVETDVEPWRGRSPRCRPQRQWRSRRRARAVRGWVGPTSGLRDGLAGCQIGHREKGIARWDTLVYPPDGS